MVDLQNLDVVGRPAGAGVGTPPAIHEVKDMAEAMADDTAEWMARRTSRVPATYTRRRTSRRRPRSLSSSVFSATPTPRRWRRMTDGFQMTGDIRPGIPEPDGPRHLQYVRKKIGARHGGDFDEKLLQELVAAAKRLGRRPGRRVSRPGVDGLGRGLSHCMIRTPCGSES